MARVLEKALIVLPPIMICLLFSIGFGQDKQSGCRDHLLAHPFEVWT
jgi:hypothetical protein